MVIGGYNNNTPFFNLSTNHTAPSTAASYSDADGAIKQWESHTNTKLTNKHIIIANEAYSKHHRENRGITRNDIIALGYTKDYAKKILFECQSNGFLVHLEGHKQGKFNEYFLATEIDRFLQKQRNTKKQDEPTDSLQPTVIQILVYEINQ